MNQTLYSDAYKKFGSVRKAAKALGIPRSTFFDEYNREKATDKVVHRVHNPRTIKCRSGNDIKRYIFTSSIRGASVHSDFFCNLQAYAKHIGAKLVIGALCNRGRHQLHSEFDVDEHQKELLPYICDHQIILEDQIQFCPELNLTPAMVLPLQGLQTYTKKRWGIFPHPKISVETVPTHKSRPTKFNYTTGTVTHPYYSATKAGYRAHFDHVYGALIVEVTRTGVWCRHVTPVDEVNGAFYDLNYIVSDGKIINYGSVAAIVYGDVHVEELDEACASATWGYSGGGFDEKSCLAGVLHPTTQVFHDMMSMSAANHHELSDMFERYKRWFNSENLVERNFRNAADFMTHVASMGDYNIIIDSNHDYFIRKWMLGFDPSMREDFDNIETYYEMKLATLNAIRKADEPFSFLELALRTLAPMHTTTFDHFRFLRRDESYELLNVELSWHGDYGANGSKGSRNQFRFFTGKSTIGHSHSPGINSGVHQVGTCSKLDLGYNHGASSWAHTHDILYPHGGRTLITMSDGKFWADQ